MSKSKIISAMIISVVVISMATPVFATNQQGSGFTDIDGHWAKETITKWKDYEIIKGVGSNKFAPNDTIDRKDFAVIIDNLLGYNTDKVYSISDLKNEEYFSKAMNSLIGANILRVEDNKVRPYDKITREEAAEILCKAFKLETKYHNIDAMNNEKISSWAIPYISTMLAEGFMRGDTKGNINPTSNLTRAEAITLMSNILGELYLGDIDSKDFIEATLISPNPIITHTKVGDLRVLNAKEVRVVDSDINNLRVDAEKLSVTDSKISNIEAITDNSSIDISSSNIYNISIEGKNISVNSDNDNLGKIKIKGGCSASINGKTIQNSNEFELVYESASDILDIDKNIKLAHSINADNLVSLSVSTNEVGVLEEGVLINDTDTIPTMEKHSNISKIEGKLEKKISEGIKQITVRPYIKLSNDITKYGEAIIIRANNYKLGLKLNNTEVIRNDKAGSLSGIKKEVLFSLKGENTSNIQDIKMISSKDNILGDITKHVSTLQLISDTSVENITNKIYKSNIIFSVNSNGIVELDRFYGYRIKFKDGTQKEIFPLVEDTTIPENYTEEIKTGEGKLVSNTLHITGNSYKSSNSIVEETGIVYTIQDYMNTEPDAVTSNWTEVKCEGITNDVIIELNDTTDSKIYYAFYVKTNRGISYGQINQIVGRTSPILTGNQSVKVNGEGTIASIKIGVETSSDIDLENSKIHNVETCSINIDKYTEKSLLEIGGQYKDGMLSLVISDLKPDSEYKVRLLVKNEVGILDNIVVQFNTK